MELKTRNPLLKFDPAEPGLRKSLSAALFVGERLWVASDELNSKGRNSVERLSTSDGEVFDGHTSFTLDAQGDTLVRGESLKPVLEIKTGRGTDHPEGFALVPGGDAPRRILVVYDSPGENRTEAGPSAVTADVFDLPPVK